MVPDAEMLQQHWTLTNYKSNPFEHRCSVLHQHNIWLWSKFKGPAPEKQQQFFLAPPPPPPEKQQQNFFCCRKFTPYKQQVVQSQATITNLAGGTLSFIMFGSSSCCTICKIKMKIFYKNLKEKEKRKKVTHTQSYSWQIFKSFELFSTERLLNQSA